MATVMRMAPMLPAYGGALALALSAEQRSAPAAEIDAPPPPTSYPQPVHSDDTPQHEIDAMMQRAMLAQFQGMGVEVTEVKQVTDEKLIELGGMDGAHHGS